MLITLSVHLCLSVSLYTRPYISSFLILTYHLFLIDFQLQLFFPFFLSLWRDLPSALLLSSLLISLTFYSPLLSSSLTFLFIFCFSTFNIFLFIRLRSRAYYNPPTPLVAGYYNCTYTVRDGIFSSSSIKYIAPYLLTMFSWLLLCHFWGN